MSGTGNPKNPIVRSFARSRQLGWRLAPAIAVPALVGWWFLHGSTAPKPTSTGSAHPELAAPAGGTNHSPAMDAANQQQNQLDARNAEQNHRSYAAPLSGANQSDGGAVSELGAPPQDDKALHPQESGQPDTKASAPAPVTKAATTPSGGEAAKPSTPPAQTSSETTGVSFAGSTPGDTGSAPSGPGYSDAARTMLFAAWSGRAATLDVDSPTGRNQTGNASGASGNYATMPSEGGTASDTGAVRPVSYSGTIAPRPPSSGEPASKTVLLPAGRGVYGHAVLTSNSDLGDQVLVQIDSGPFIGDRVSGTFSMKNDRLIVKIDKLLRDDGTDQPVDAILVSPETAETGVASEVNEHLFTRIMLPAAAAFVQGLGQAFQTSNTTSTTNGFGGVTGFTKLTLPQQLGVAAGQAGEQFGQILSKVTPQQATVILRKGDSVGVMFLSTVYAP